MGAFMFFGYLQMAKLLRLHIFGRSGLTNQSGYSIIYISKHLKGSNPFIVSGWTDCVRMGALPFAEDGRKICSLLPSPYSGNHCTSSAHVYSAIPLTIIVYLVCYHYFCHSKGDTDRTSVVIYCGGHSNFPKLISSSLKEATSLVQSAKVQN